MDYTTSSDARGVFPNGTIASIMSTNCVTTAIYAGVPSGAVYAGVAYYNCTTVDSNKLSSSCLFSVKVQDVEPPTLVCPGERTFQNIPGKNYSSIDVLELQELVILSDNYDTVTTLRQISYCDFNFSLTDNPAIQNAYLSTSGLKTKALVHCFSTDSSSNTGNCSFNVSAYDDEAPILGGKT